MRDIVVIGASGFGREVLDVLEAINQAEPTFNISGVIDDNPSDTSLRRLRDRGYKHLGRVADWLPTAKGNAYVIGIGATEVRMRIATVLDAHGAEAVPLIHPAATLGSRSVASAGAVICAGARISTNVSLGRHVHVNSAALIGHDSILYDFVSLNPGAIVSGECVLDTGVLVGAGAVILQNLHVEQFAVVGASACVVRRVPTNSIARGVPATIYAKEKHGFS